ncbi:phosphoglycerate kinase [Candidatus Uhrbacteria bacterium]|nr:phosphoglycerate kinase [Candidatus Uhrbacteria bacterium]
MQLRSLRKIKNLPGQRVLVRLDFNVALRAGRIPPTEYHRIKAALPTLKWLKRRGARIIVMTHLGRPGGKRVKGFSTQPLARLLAQFLKTRVGFVSDLLGSAALQSAQKMKDGEIIFLENLRFYPGEEKNDPRFARRLARLADVFVNDAFSVSHRSHASVVGVARLLSAFAGFLLKKEIDNLSKILEHPKRPLMVVMAGAKVSTKLPVMKHLLSVADLVLAGGGLANTIWKAQGYGVGASMIDQPSLRQAKIMGKNRKLILPMDVKVFGKKKTRIVGLPSEPSTICQKSEKILDAGPATVHHFIRHLKKAGTAVWNGPLGRVEDQRFAQGTRQLAIFLARHARGRAFVAVGGGDTVPFLSTLPGFSSFDFVSLGGAAMLEYLSGKSLPGLKPLLIA